MENTDIKYIKPDAVVSMKVSAGYHARMMACVEFYLKSHCADSNGEIDIEKLRKANEQIYNQDIKEEWVFHYQTLLISVLEFEKLVEQEGLLTTEPPIQDQ